MNKNQDTIFALSTPPGKSAIAVLRISGHQAYEFISKISSNMPKDHSQATFNKIFDKKKNLIDQTITTFFKSPKSFTGEDMVEISLHGGSAVIKKFVKEISNNKNIRLAEPGEFTRRAFENNKLDLTQVEAISDIVNAETEIQRKQAISHLSGHFFSKTKKIFDDLKNVLANIEAVIDFSEEDLPEDLLKNVKEQRENIINTIDNILLGKNFGISIRDGFTIAILGKPNTGKSSFINNVSGRDVAIVTNNPGTTRDLLESFVDLFGLPVRFVDTAGLRKSKNKIEKIGVEKAINLSKDADINLVFINNTLDKNEFSDFNNVIFVKSKQDLNLGKFYGGGFYNISSKSNYGVSKILEIIRRKLIEKHPKENEHISRERHVRCLTEAKKHLENSKQSKNIDIFAEDIRLATNEFSKLFGTVDIEDILDIVFSDFCIGK